MFYLVKSPWILKKLYSSCIWEINTSEKELFLTFDDGPQPGVTDFVLDQLDKFNAKATFFCIGKNVVANKEIFERITREGHSVGNHTYTHLNGWKTDDKEYLRDIEDAKGIIHSDLFRPPYGRITRFQLQQMNSPRFRLKVIMWSVLSGDFDPQAGKDQCYLNVASNAGPGSIIVFHDSIKAFEKLKQVLPMVLELFSERGYIFKAIAL